MQLWNTKFWLASPDIQRYFIQQLKINNTSYPVNLTGAINITHKLNINMKSNNINEIMIK